MTPMTSFSCATSGIRIPPRDCVTGAIGSMTIWSSTGTMSVGMDSLLLWNWMPLAERTSLRRPARLLIDVTTALRTPAVRTALAQRTESQTARLHFGPGQGTVFARHDLFGLP